MSDKVKAEAAAGNLNGPQPDPATMLPGVAEGVCVCHEGKEEVAERNNVSSLWVDDGDVELEGVVMKGIAGSPGAVNASTLDIDPTPSHEFSRSKHETWVLGAIPGSPVMLPPTVLPPKSQDMKSKGVFSAPIAGGGWDE